MSNKDSANSFFSKYKQNLVEDIHTFMLAEIDEYNHEEMTAKVMPLNKYRMKNNVFEERSLLIEVPIMHFRVKDFYIRPPYQEGDIVVVAFFDEDTENSLLTGEIEETNSTRKHSLDDAMIVGTLRTFEKPEYPSDREEGLLISNEDDTFEILLGKNGSIDVKTDEKIKISSKENELFEFEISKSGAIDIKSEQQININSATGVRITGPRNSSTW